MLGNKCRVDCNPPYHDFLVKGLQGENKFMKSDHRDLIKDELHPEKKRIEKVFKEVRNQQKTCSEKEYLETLLGCLPENIKKSVDEVYKTVCSKLYKDKTIKRPRLIDSICEEVRTVYDQQLKKLFPECRLGHMLEQVDTPSFDEYKKSFYETISKSIEKQKSYLNYEYFKALKQDRYNLYILIFSVLGGLGVCGGVVEQLLGLLQK